jgi:hypothetical protein
MRIPVKAQYGGPAILAVTILTHVLGGLAWTQTGEIRIEGEHVTRLVLMDSRGGQKVLSELGGKIALPAGDYRLYEAMLEGGQFCRGAQASAHAKITVSPDSVATLKVGAPLRHGVRIVRQGPVMVLHYELVGQGGERYSMNSTSDSRGPSFAVYKGDDKVASGDFEFG